MLQPLPDGLPHFPPDVARLRARQSFATWRMQHPERPAVMTQGLYLSSLPASMPEWQRDLEVQMLLSPPTFVDPKHHPLLMRLVPGTGQWHFYIESMPIQFVQDAAEYFADDEFYAGAISSIPALKAQRQVLCAGLRAELKRRVDWDRNARLSRRNLLLSGFMDWMQTKHNGKDVAQIIAGYASAYITPKAHPARPLITGPLCTRREALRAAWHKRALQTTTESSNKRART